MHRLFILPSLLFLLCCHSPSPTPRGNYYSRFKINGFTYRLYLNLSKPTLMSIGFRGEEIPLDTFYFKNDTLHFGRADFYSEFIGYHDPRTGIINGQWIAEDSVSYPSTFVPVLPDTIVGLRPRTSKVYTYQPPPPQHDSIKVYAKRSAHAQCTAG